LAKGVQLEIQPAISQYGCDFQGRDCAVQIDSQTTFSEGGDNSSHSINISSFAENNETKVGPFIYFIEAQFGLCSPSPQPTIRWVILSLFQSMQAVFCDNDGRPDRGTLILRQGTASLVFHACGIVVPVTTELAIKFNITNPKFEQRAPDIFVSGNSFTHNLS